MAEENGYGQCYCEEGDDTRRPDERNSIANMLGCRSLNWSMIKRDGLIVARSNHFAEMEKKQLSEDSLWRAAGQFSPFSCYQAWNTCRLVASNHL